MSKKKNNWIPLINIIIHASDGQPPTGSPHTNVLTTINIIAINAIKQKIIPIIADITNGVVENAKIPSNAYLNNCQKFHFVSPATLFGAL